MNISNKTGDSPGPVQARVANGKLSVDLTDGRTISVPLRWYPRLLHGTRAEWRNFELNLAGIHWPDLNEDIPVEGLLAGRKSGESPRSLRKWLKYRAQGLKEPIPEMPLPPDMEETLARIILAEQKKPRVNRRRAG